jgi:hypothetical protein
MITKAPKKDINSWRKRSGAEVFIREAEQKVPFFVILTIIIRRNLPPLLYLQVQKTFSTF